MNLVERLRDSMHGGVCVEAAAEIERLRAALTDIRGLTRGYQDADDVLVTITNIVTRVLEQSTRGDK